MEYAPRFGFASSKTGLLDNTRVRVVLVAVVAILVFLFVGHLCYEVQQTKLIALLSQSSN